MSTQLPTIFAGYTIRNIIVDDQVYFSVVDFIKALTDSPDASDYWNKLKVRDSKEGCGQLSTSCRSLKLVAEDGKKRVTDCTTIEGLLRVLQSVPSPRAEPAKQWLAKVGNDRLDEMNDPELAIGRGRSRALEYYTKRGFTPENAIARVKGIEKRNELTDAFKAGGVSSGKDYALLTAKNHRGTFGITPSVHKEIKGLNHKEKLRDYYVSGEHSLSMLSEVMLTQAITSSRAQTPKAVAACVDANAEMMSEVRAVIERKTGKRIATSDRPKLLK